jgi:hypothetical protein
MIVRISLRSSLVLILAAAVTCAPLCAYGNENSNSSQSFAVITEAKAALLDHATAIEGATIYQGDTMETDPTGVLRIRARGSQLYMNPNSVVQLETSGPGLIRTSLLKGRVGFSSGASDLVEVQIGDMLIRSRPGVAARGEVEMITPENLRVSSIEGTFDFTFDGVTETVASGKSYQATVTQDTPANPDYFPHESLKAEHHPHEKLTWILLGIAGGIVGGYFVNQCLTESPSTP